MFEAELYWLRRRSQAIVTKEYLAERISYSEGIKRKSYETLLKWAYTDGTVYYLDRNPAEAENSKRRALGTHVWRRSTNEDAVHQDCMGPSAYSNGQGMPCKVWGFLACGVLHIHVLDEGESNCRSTGISTQTWSMRHSQNGEVIANTWYVTSSHVFALKLLCMR